MKYVVNKIVELIYANGPSKDKETMVRVDGFEDINIYNQVAIQLKNNIDKLGLTIDIKLARNKWNEFNKSVKNTSVLQFMKQQNWVAEQESMTYYRNLHDFNVVVLLGTENEEDKGGLANFQSITPETLVNELNGKYHKLFKDDSFTDSDNDIIDRLYKDLFEFEPIDICKLSDIADTWNGRYSNSNEFIELFFKELPIWGLPFRSLTLPKNHEIIGRKNVLAGCHRFITRQLFNNKMSITQYNKYLKKIDYYNADGADTAKYSGNNECWSEQGINSYDEFSKVLKEFIVGDKLQENTEKLLKVDYSIIEDVLGIALPKQGKKPKDKTKVLLGEPIEVFTNALFTTLVDIKNKKIDVENIEFNFSQAEIVCMYSNVDGAEEKQQLFEEWQRICVHCGGIVEYLNKRFWSVNDNEITLSCEPEGFLVPSHSHDFIEDNDLIKPAASNKCISKIDFSTIYSDGDKKYKLDFQWKFDVNNAWDKNFGELCLQNFCKQEGTNYIPISDIRKINSLIFSKSEEEFFERLKESDVSFGFNLNEYINKKMPLDEADITFEFDKVGKAFSKFVHSISIDGFYACIAKDNSELVQLCSAYTDLGKYLRNRGLAENLKWVLDAYINSFNIINDVNFIESEKDIESCIVPAWHPATLEKINDRNIFFLDGCNEWWDKVQGDESINEKQISDTLLDLIQMCKLQSTLDLFPSYGQVFFGAISSYGAFSLYGRNDIKNENRLIDMIHKEAIYDDDFDKKEVSKFNDNAKMIYGIMLDYAKAFPNTADNLNLVFIDPSELQPIVAAIYKYIAIRKEKSKNEKIDISLRILVKPENKGGRNYLAYWMDEFFSQDENVCIHTYLNEWNSKSQLEKLLNSNNDIAFVMDLLKVNNLGFVVSHNKEILAPSQCRFPIVYKPTPISSTSVNRTIELSQPQFKAAYEHTQIVRYRNNMEEKPREMYIASRSVSMDSDGQNIVHFLHEKAYWVVCVDSGMDGALLRSDNNHLQDYNIIGFSTGKGAYGQYNLTITTRKFILDTVKRKLENRLYSLFKWDKVQIKQAAQLCIDEASGLDGISLLSAINPKDENIREFLAYILTSLKEKKTDSESVLKIVIHLYSYKHWFNGTVDKDKDDSASRPDFLVLEAFLSDGEKLKLKATVTECKTSLQENADQHKKHAIEQVKHGVCRLSEIFNPDSKSIKRRYWYAQLYRALTFAQVTFKNNTAEFSEISSKLRSVLDGNYEIEWHSRILGYWIDMPGDNEIECITDDGITICDIPQKVIQSYLLNNTVDNVNFVNVDSTEFIEDEEQQNSIDDIEKKLDEEMELSRTRKNKNVKLEQNMFECAEHDRVANDSLNENNQTEVKDININDLKNELKDESDIKLDKLNVLPDMEENENSKENTIKISDSKTKLEEIRVLIGKSKSLSDVYWEFGNPQTANRHLLITGTSGQGKTYSIQTMLYELHKNNIPSVVFDYTEGFRLDQLEPEFVDSMGNRINQHIVKIQGVPINPFKRQEQDFAGMKIKDTSADVAGRLANILTHVYGFGEQQYAAIYEATRVGMDKYGDAMDMQHLKKELELIQSKNSSAKTVISKMTPFFHSIEFNKDANFDWGDVLYAEEAKMNIFQLTMIDREMQVIVTELMLWDAWYYTKNYGSKDKPFVVVLDEAQNLSHKENSPSKAILTEGRKFGWSAWFATQSLKVLADDEVVRLMQAAFKLYFKPTDEEITKMSKQLDPSNSSLWIGALKALKKGQCIVVGDRIKDDGTFGGTKPTVTNVTSFKERI